MQATLNPAKTIKIHRMTWKLSYTLLGSASVQRKMALLLKQGFPVYCLRADNRIKQKRDRMRLTSIAVATAIGKRRCGRNHNRRADAEADGNSKGGNYEDLFHG